MESKGVDPLPNVLKLPLVFFVVGSQQVIPCDVPFSATIAEVKEMLFEKYGLFV
jgi:hypothetical protein